MENSTLLSLANNYGCPLYVYDAERIIFQYNRLTKAFAGNNPLQINYATKALSNISVLKLLKSLGSNLDCVSIGEVLLGLEAGFEPKRISYTPNGVSMKELEEVQHLGAKITIDNLYTLRLFAEKFPDASVSIRINPQIMAGGNEKISVGHVNSKFGILKQHMEEVHRIVEETGINIIGVHMHTGSDILDVDIFLKGSEVLMGIAKEFENLEFIDFGGGFKVPYKEGDKSTNIELFAEKFKLRFSEFCEEYGRNLIMVFEPGKFLVSECGYFLAKVNTIKPSTNIVFVALDTGFNHLIRPMYYNAYHNITNISKPEGKEKKYNIVGYICETDTFAQEREISEISAGDILCFHNAGAYCFSMASNYNSRYLPAEVLFYKGKDYLIREAETFKDILRNQTKIELPL
ncbi:diaminopimelate decarboxylase [Namhaeicola litoreus]|uniref:Diaminopimelate decarboxylase n=1 Tax=Namhaeicola litoreus TaxID=1052145 RepID=A0ABW3Y4V7_9FLAO